MLQRYRDLFEIEGVRATLVGSIIGRLPIGIATLALLLFVQNRSGSFARAGVASAMYVLGLALIAPFLGRLIDRIGPRPVLTACAALYPATLVSLTLLVMNAAPDAAVNAIALLAGASLPPVTVCTRTLYPRIVKDPSLLQTAYSVDSALVELVFVLGPALVAACVAAGHPEAAVLLAALSATVGSFAFARTPPVKAWAGAKASRGRDWLGALRNPKLLIVFVTTTLYSVSFGLFEVAVNAHATQHGSAAMGGVILALVSVGSGAGALIYGARHWRSPPQQRFPIALLALSAGMLLLVPIANLTLYASVSVIAGIPMATVIATQSLVVARLAPSDRLAESFTWSATCLLGGISAGFAAGGALADAVPAYWLLIAAAAMTASAAALARSAL